ncbi:MAG: TIGR00341 family protein [Candidatus Gracilibacteria bacterium]|nr:TIGR00341 family protein [Candidatus Gracilibacteria bacterium]
MTENLNIEEIINKKSETFGDKVTAWFDKIEFLDLSPEEKEEVAVKVKNDAVPDKLYRIEIFLSSVIAALGLLQNSVAVVIGAMLIAPLLRPINGISFAVARGEKPFFWISMRVMFFSVLVSVIMGFFSVKITGLTVETSEILSRTSPNIIDLFIAIFSAMVAVLSLGFSRLGESVAGVAMAAALMPPLAVVGIELELGNYTLAGGAMMLFLANLVAIVLVGAVIFWLYGFTPHSGIKQKSAVKGFTFIVFVIFIISVPLVSSLLSVKEKRELEFKSIDYLQNIIKQETLNFTISSLEIKSLDKDLVKISSVIKIPEGLDFYDTFKKQLDFELSKKLGRNVELDVELIRTANIISIEKINLSDIELKKQEIQKQFQDFYILNQVTGVDLKLIEIKSLRDHINLNITFEVDIVAKDDFEKFLNKLKEYYKNYENIKLGVKFGVYKTIDLSN